MEVTFILDLPTIQGIIFKIILMKHRILYIFLFKNLYSRSPDHVDPPYNPSKVLMVQRIKCLKKKPYWDKNVMTELGLDDKVSNG